jgi:hypothetical protein
MYRSHFRQDSAQQRFKQQQEFLSFLSFISVYIYLIFSADAIVPCLIGKHRQAALYAHTFCMAVWISLQLRQHITSNVV